MIKLTVIIPVYNCEKHIKKCIDSIIPQLEEDYELLLINDGSKDSSRSIIEEYHNKYPELIRVINKENEGVALTRNLGIREARGEFLCFIDNDDYIEDNYFKEYVSVIEASDYDVVIGGYKRVGDNSTKFFVHPINSDWYKFTVLAPWAKIFRKQFLLENEIYFWDYKTGEDVYFNLKIFACTNKIYIINNIGYNWYYNERSVSNTIQKGFNKSIDIIKLLDKVSSIGKDKDQFFQYFYTRYIVWYLLFSGRTATKEDFILEYKKTSVWMQKKKIPFKFPVFSRRIKGERLSVRLAVGGFLVIRKMHLMKIFIKIFCKG